MRIGIIGVGIIGGALKYGFEKLGHEIVVHDIKLDTRIQDVIGTDAIFVCVPTPSNLDGSCDTSIVDGTVKDLVDFGYNNIICIKSTVAPGTTARLIKETGYSAICFVPEFLRERAAIVDFMENHDLLAVGTTADWIYNKIVEIHGKYPKKIIKLSPTEAELLKYMSNTYNAMKVIFANEMFEVANAVGADYMKVKEAFVKRGTAVDLYLDCNENFRGYAGMCLPKDVAALDALIVSKGLDLNLFNMLQSENRKFKKTVPAGMRA